MASSSWHQGSEESEEEKIARLRSKFWALTGEHSTLLDLCVGITKPPTIQGRIHHECLTYNDLALLSKMAQIELVAGMEKCLEGGETEAQEASVASPEPHPFDVFLMMETLGFVMNNRKNWSTSTSRPTSNGRNKPLALCLPDKNQFVWYDGYLDVTPLEEQQPKWRVASLSGTARILSALSEESPLKNLAMMREGLVDAVEVAVDDESRLNYSQRQAVETVASPSFQSGFFVIQGPPGCGKTTTCVEMIMEAIKYEQDPVVVCAPSNAAVANAALKYLECQCNYAHGSSWSLPSASLLDRVVVFGENCDQSVHFLNPLHRGRYFDKKKGDFEKLCKEADPSKIERLQRSLCQELVAWLHLSEDQEWTLSDLAQLCPYINMEMKQQRMYYASLLARAEVLFSTLNSLGSMMLRNNIKARTIFFDEAGQSPEAEFYIAATFPGVERMIVMGDPMQLPATVIDRQCLNEGYGKSFLENVYQLDPEKVHLLNTQYRMDPEILAFPNATFYQEKIRSGDNVLQRQDPLIEKPFLFIDTAGKGSEEKEGHSWMNSYEATLIKSIIFDDQDTVRFIKESSSPVRIIIITPYRSQAQLLESLLQGTTRGHVRIELATVDSFQGQEAEIVILSTVRTRGTGFVDNTQRLNVALTRAKRVLRVVGDKKFFLSLGQGSTLRKLARYAVKQERCEEAKLGALAWCRPNWEQTTLWKPVWTSRFHQCVREMGSKQRNIALNTLLAVAKGDESALHGFIPERERPGFYVSALKEFYGEVRIVWIAKMGQPPLVEAIFAGSYARCRNFIQLQPHPPADACIVERGLKGIKSYQEENLAADEVENDSDVWIAWAATNMNQNIVLQGGELPSGSLELDSEQEHVARSPPPLMIESRSGTGKTLVLLQHAAYYADHGDERPSCFVTVSPRLCSVIEKQYEAMNQANNMSLKTTFFFSFGNLLRALLQQKSICDFDEMNPCTYLGFEQVRRSHKKSEVEPHLIESEIGGVIVGSLAAAEKRAPLTREEYLVDKRSNVGRYSQRDVATRGYIYDRYEEYCKWKQYEGFYDNGDVVMRLLQEKLEQRFSAAYIDEVQDMTYASIH